MNDLDVCAALFADERARHLDRVPAALNADHLPGGTDTPSEQVQTTLRTTTNLDRTSTRRHGQPVEQPRRLISEWASLFLQPLLLRPPITQKVFVPLRHLVPLRRR